MTYGFGYKGSKSQIADKIINFLPQANTLYDLFGGGGAITHCAALSSKYDRVVYNDSGDCAKLFEWAVDGIYKHTDPMRFITREMFFAEKDTNPFVKYEWSFGNNGKDYLYGKNIEQYKHCLHNAVVYSDMEGLNQLLSIDVPVFDDVKGLKERRLKYRRLFEGRGRTYQQLQHLQHLERLQRLERLQHLQHLERLEIHNKSYSSFTITEGVIYCDIPYINTQAGCYAGFNHEAFYNWAENQKVPVYISEYNMPSDRFECVWSTPKRQLSTSKGTGKLVNECIFVPKKQIKKGIIKNGCKKM